MSAKPMGEPVGTKPAAPRPIPRLRGSIWTPMPDSHPARQLRHRAARFVNAAPLTVRAPRGVLSLSFDDFPASAWTEGGRVLADHGVKATYYLCGGLCAEAGAGDGHDRAAQFEVPHLEALVEAGHELGCHTFGHDNALVLNGFDFAASLDANADWVAERLDGYRMRSFAFPYGDWSVGAKRVVARRFLAGRGVRNGLNAGRVDRAGLHAIGLESRRLPGYDLDALVERTAASRGWLIAYGHDITDAPSAYGCRPEDLDRLIRLAKAAGLDILPVAAAVEAFSGARAAQAA